MLASWSIKKKLVLCVALIALIVLTLSVTGIISVFTYRDVVRTVSCRSAELPCAQALIDSLDNLAKTFPGPPDLSASHGGYNGVAEATKTRVAQMEVEKALSDYRARLEQTESGGGISDNREELQAVERIESTLQMIKQLHEEHGWAFIAYDHPVRDELETLRGLAAEIPVHLQNKMSALKGNVQGQYRTLIVVTISSSLLTAILLTWLIKFFYDGVAAPLRIVIHGSRRVAAGDFEYQVQLDSGDEMGELAAALNAMTQRFKQIRDDLDRQVRERTQEVVRSEQLASVGFLAAGVAHEINNPLQAIAICAESLESRLHDIIAADDAKSDEEHNSEITVLRKYLRRIQDEAFRCKGITEKLLSYSRLGDEEKHATDLNAVFTDAIELIRTVSAYRGKKIEFHSSGPLVARVVPHEITQVAINLITNALDSLDSDGQVQVELTKTAQDAVLVVRDNGCGMTDEVKKHLFEPFFTRRRNGQGTGLGLSIIYRIVQDHGGEIAVASDGPGRGSLFRITLPLNHHEERHEKHQAA